MIGAGANKNRLIETLAKYKIGLMPSSRYIDAKLFDFTADGHLILDGMQGEHLIIKLGFAQVQNLDAALQKYIAYYRQEPAA